MDCGKRSSKLVASRNSKIYMDLQDIIRENALQFLPAKYLFRLQSTCRDWKLMISTPFFAHNQSLSSRSVLGFFYQAPDHPPSLISSEPESCGVPDPSLSFLPEPVEIRSSSNGLLCCQGKEKDKAYYICNPVLKQWKKLPKPKANHGPQPAIVLVFEPSILNFVVDYKLICAFASNEFDGATEFEIYSSRKGSWEISGEISFANLKIEPRSGVYANGVVYWKGGRIVAYDVAKDRSQLLEDYGYYGVSGILGTLNGEISLASLNGTSLTVQMLGNVHSNTMQMGSNLRTWKDKRTIRMGSVVGEFANDSSLLSMSGHLVVFGNKEKLCIYDFQKNEHRAVVPGCNCRNSIGLPYVNNLASLEF